MPALPLTHFCENLLGSILPLIGINGSGFANEFQLCRGVEDRLHKLQIC